jgi:hypothetical protein
MLAGVSGWASTRWHEDTRHSLEGATVAKPITRGRQAVLPVPGQSHCSIEGQAVVGNRTVRPGIRAMRTGSGVVEPSGYLTCSPCLGAPNRPQGSIPCANFVIHIEVLGTSFGGLLVLVADWGFGTMMLLLMVQLFVCNIRKAFSGLYRSVRLLVSGGGGPCA